MRQFSRAGTDGIRVTITLILTILCGPATEASADDFSLLNYLPPVKDAPKSRTSAASRSTDDAIPGIYLHAPSQIGWTTQAQPALYWHLTHATKQSVRVTVSRPRVPQPLIDLTVSTSTSNGVMSIDLADFNVTLEPDVAYRWSVAVQRDDEDGWHTSQGMIMRVQRPEVLTNELKNAPPRQRVGIYIRHHIWYDAVDQLNRLVAAQPQEAILAEIRHKLLKSVYPEDDTFSIPARPDTVETSHAASSPLPAQAPQNPLSFVLPRVEDAPRAGMIHAGVRAVGANEVLLTLLAPTDHEGLTLRPQPTLMWFISQPSHVRFRLVLSEPGRPNPLIELSLDGSGVQGIQTLDLRQFGIRLEPGRSYRWGVSLDDDPDSPAGATTVASIRRITSDQLQRTLDQAPMTQRAHMLAKNGIWYDTLAELSEHIEAGRDAQSWRGFRAQFLRAASHTEAAAFDVQP